MKITYSSEKHLIEKYRIDSVGKKNYTKLEIAYSSEKHPIEKYRIGRVGKKKLNTIGNSIPVRNILSRNIV